MCSFVDKDACNTIIFRKEEYYGVLTIRSEDDDYLGLESDMVSQFSAFLPNLRSLDTNHDPKDLNAKDIEFDLNQEDLI